MEESGYKDFVFAVDCVLLAPAKTPPEVVKWLETETLKVLSTPEMKEKLYKAGFLVRPKGADAAWARVTKEIDHVQGHHRHARHQENVRPSRPCKLAPAAARGWRAHSSKRGARRAHQNDRADRRQPADAQAGDHGRRGSAARRQRAGADRRRQRPGRLGRSGIRSGDDRRDAREHRLRRALPRARLARPRGRRHRGRARRHGWAHVRQSRRQGGDRNRAA